MTLQDLIIISGIIFFIYKLITHEGKLTLARIVAMLGMAIWIGLGLLHEVVSIFVLFFWSSVVMGISLIGMYYIIYLVVSIMMWIKLKNIKNFLKVLYTLGYF